MPPGFNAHPKHPAVAYLVRLHADIGGRIKKNRHEAEQLAEAMQHVEVVIRMFDPNYNTAGIAQKRRTQGNPWFKRGTLFREALAVLRVAGRPLTVREIATAMFEAKGADPTLQQLRVITNGIKNSLDSNNGKTVEKVGDGSPHRWRVR